MSERLAAITCPEHNSCVAILITVSKDSLDGRKPINLSYVYEGWKLRQDFIPVEVRHEAAKNTPGVAAFGTSYDQRLSKLEAFAKRSRWSRRAWRKRYGGK